MGGAHQNTNALLLIEEKMDKSIMGSMRRARLFDDF